MDKTKEEFVSFIRQAINDQSSPAASELYYFLVNCFIRADSRQTGRVYEDMFDSLIEEAAQMPRKYGYAPKSENMYPSTALRKSARAAMFRKMDTDNNGYITLEEWVKFAKDHIEGKIKQLPKDYLGGKSDDVSKEEFIDFVKQAVCKGTRESRELYFFLLKAFQNGDRDYSGTVDPVEFDLLIEEAAFAPRRFGLAPTSSSLYRTNRERLESRKKTFRNMDKNNDGKISFNEWLSYALKHINEKVNQL